MLEQFDIGRILKTALSGGGEFADLFFEEGTSTSVACEDGKVERVIAGTDRGVGIRVIADLRTAYAYTNEVTERSLLALAATVKTAVQGKNFAGSIDMRSKAVAASFPIAKPVAAVPLADKVALATLADRTARSLDPRVRQVMVVYRDSTTRVQVANSNGEFREQERTGTIFLVQTVAAEGDIVQTGYEPIGGFRGFELVDGDAAEEVARKSVKRAVTLLSAPKAPGGMMPVVLSSDAGGTMVHEAIGHGLEADLAHTGLSVYKGKIGQQVASPLVTVIDDATIPHARGSFAFDDEGIDAQKTILVENGILLGYMYDRLSAMKAGTTSTGNGRRESYQVKPIVRMTNTLIASGQSMPGAVIAAAENGLFVKKMGGGQVNTVNGDFVFEVSEGYLIERGQIGEMVRGATLTGNGPEVLQKITMVGNDLGFGMGTCGKEGQGVPVADAQPTLLIREMTVGGAA